MSAAKTPPVDPGTYRRYLAAVTLFHQTAADAHGLSGTDYQAANLLDLDGPMTSGELARRLALSTGAATRLVDRLVDAGVARRTDDPGDRRRALVEHTGVLPDGLPATLARVGAPIARALAGLDAHQRAGVEAYLTAAAEAYAAEARRLRDG